MKPNYKRPCKPYDNAFPDEEQFGLTKREYFAAMAMQGLLADPNTSIINGWNRDYLAEEAKRQADALIEALNEEPK